MRPLRTALSALLAAALLVAAAPAAHAAPDIGDFLNRDADGDCPTYGDLEICSGHVPSFDGSKLDVDVTLPLNDQGSRSHPLIVMLHGFGNNKHEWESLTDEAGGGDKHHWNSHWFAKHGYYVLTYTARGFRDDGPTAPYQPDTPSFTSVDLPSGTIHLKSRDFEGKDTQYLAALVAAGFPDVDAERVAVTGGSYGGGEAWLLATRGQWTFPHELDPSLPVLDLQVAVPKYPWTDLAYSLAPNGHGGGPAGTDIHESSQGRPRSDTGEGNPIGSVKLSYVNGFFAIGSARGVFEQGTSTTQPNPEGPINITAWKARVADAGDPYDAAGAEDPIVKQVRRGLTEFRSAYYQDEGLAAQAEGRKVAVFAIQGWTDDLFTAVEAFRMYKLLKRLDPRWPVEVELADVGHSRAQNEDRTWQRLNRQAFQFLQAHVDGTHEQRTALTSQPAVCARGGDTGKGSDTAARRISAQTPEGLSNGSLEMAFPAGATVSPLGVADPNGPATDAVFGGAFDAILAQSRGPCRESPGPALGGYTAVSEPLPDATAYVGLGFVELPYTFAGQTATLNARVWDVLPDGRELLVTRGTYRIDVPAYDTPAGTLRLPLYGNHWPFPPGHRIRLDLTQVDQPTYRPSNEPSGIAFDEATLVLPTRESGTSELSGEVVERYQTTSTP